MSVASYRKRIYFPTHVITLPESTSGPLDPLPIIGSPHSYFLICRLSKMVTCYYEAVVILIMIGSGQYTLAHIEAAREVNAAQLCECVIPISNP